MDSSHDTNANGRDHPVTQPQDPRLFDRVLAAALSAGRPLDVPQRVNSLKHLRIGTRRFEAVAQALEKPAQQHFAVG